MLDKSHPLSKKCHFFVLHPFHTYIYGPFAAPNGKEKIIYLYVLCDLCCEYSFFSIYTAYNLTAQLEIFYHFLCHAGFPL